MEFMSIEWEIVTDVLCCVSFDCQSVSQCGGCHGRHCHSQHAIVMSEMLKCTLCIQFCTAVRGHTRLLIVWILLACGSKIKCNYSLLRWTSHIPSKIKSVWYTRITSIGKCVFKQHCAQAGAMADGVIGGWSANKESIFQLHFCFYFCSLEKRRAICVQFVWLIKREKEKKVIWEKARKRL